MYELKKNKEAFTMVEGPFKNKRFEPGKSYDAIPECMSGSFVQAGAPSVRPEPVEPAKEAAKPEPVDDAKKGRK